MDDQDDAPAPVYDAPLVEPPPNPDVQPRRGEGGNPR
jgi:hypothetical protein